MRKSGKHSFVAVLGLMAICLVSASYCDMAVAGERPTQVLTVAEIEARATEYFMKQALPGKDNAEVKVEFNGKDIELPEGLLELDFYIPGKIAKSGRVPFFLSVKVNQAIVRRLQLICQLKLYMDVVKARQDLPRGRVLTENDIVVDRELVGIPTNGAIENIEDAIGLRVTRSLKSDTILTASFLEKAPVVKKGDRVLLVAERGGMKVSVMGVVQETGYEGSVVQVENMESKKKVYGWVVDSGTVQVKF